MEDECFFWFGREEALAFRRLAPHLALKINVAVRPTSSPPMKPLAPTSSKSAGGAESGVGDACQARQMKLMVYHKEKDPAALRASLRWGVQMINRDHGDVVAK